VVADQSSSSPPPHSNNSNPPREPHVEGRCYRCNMVLLRVFRFRGTVEAGIIEAYCTRCGRPMPVDAASVLLAIDEKESNNAQT
jgi:hypothetical protein